MPHAPAASTRRRIAATLCLAAVAATLLIGTPRLFRSSAYDPPLQAALAQAADHRRALLASGVSPEALDEHHRQAQTRVDTLRVRRRIDRYTRAAVHFGLTLAFFLAWRALRQPPPPAPGPAPRTGCDTAPGEPPAPAR